MSRRSNSTARRRARSCCLFEATGLCHSDHHVQYRRSGRRDAADDRRARGRGRRAGSRARGSRPESGRSCGGVIPARVRAAAAGAPAGTRTSAIWARSSCSAYPGRRHIPTARARARTSASWLGVGSFSEFEHRVGNIVGQGRRRPAAVSRVPAGLRVMTGWGSAVNTADVTPGDTVVVIGCGGIGSGAIQGARLGGRRAHRRRRHRGRRSARRLSSSAPPIS